MKVLPNYYYTGSDCAHISSVTMLSGSFEFTHRITDPSSRHQLCLLQFNHKKAFF